MHILDTRTKNTAWEPFVDDRPQADTLACQIYRVGKRLKSANYRSDSIPTEYNILIYTIYLFSSSIIILLYGFKVFF